MTVKEIKNLLDKLNVKRDDCFEKDELINRLKETKSNRGRPPPASSGPSRKEPREQSSY
jgi:hypothetical protein